jgi:hypothetical protein
MMKNDERYTESELFPELSKHGGWNTESIKNLASSVVKVVIPGAFKNDEFRVRSYTEAKDCKPLKSFGLELLKEEDRTNRPPLICGMRMLIPKDDPQGKRLAARVPVDDVYLLGNNKNRKTTDKPQEQAVQQPEIKKGRSR